MPTWIVALTRSRLRNNVEPVLARMIIDDIHRPFLQCTTRKCASVSVRCRLPRFDAHHLKPARAVPP